MSDVPREFRFSAGRAVLAVLDANPGGVTTPDLMWMAFVSRPRLVRILYAGKRAGYLWARPARTGRAGQPPNLWGRTDKPIPEVATPSRRAERAAGLSRSPATG